MNSDPIIIIGAGLAGLASAVILSARGAKVIVLEKEAYVGGKMREQTIGSQRIDAGPTVLTMKWVFDQLFDLAGRTFENEINIRKATTLARHAWDDSDHFDLFANQEETEQEIDRFFGGDCVAGYRRFCTDSAAIFNTLKDSYISAPRPSPLGLAQRVGLTNPHSLLGLKPFQSLWQALGGYFPDSRLQQLFGRYATYVGSSPFQAPATLMLIAHVERQGVWFVEGGMHTLANTMAKAAIEQGAEIRRGAAVHRIITNGSGVSGVELDDKRVLNGRQILFCGDVSQLVPDFIDAYHTPQSPVPSANRSLSAVTWCALIRTGGFPLKRHNVFFSENYRHEFEQLIKKGQVPADPTVYICAQDRETEVEFAAGAQERILCLINAPAFGDERRLNQQEISRCLDTTISQLQRCGLDMDRNSALMEVTQPADFEKLYPGSGGALYGRASHGWTASFSRPGTKTKIPGLYLAGGSVHPGAGVPMATLSGMLAAEQIMADHVSM